MKKTKPLLKRAFEKAEENTKKKETIDLGKVTREAEKAQKLGYGIYKLRRVNPAPFTQSNSRNLHCLIASGYLTDAEWNISSKIQTLCEMNTNAIVNPETKEFMSISEIAELLQRSRVAVSTAINQLLRKGILYEIVNAEEIREHGRPVTARPLYMNPECYYAGNRNRINGILCRICMKSDQLEKKGIKMPWKVWYTSGDKYGKLITRHTYLKYRKEHKKAKCKNAPLKLVQVKDLEADNGKG